MSLGAPATPFIIGLSPEMKEEMLEVQRANNVVWEERPDYEIPTEDLFAWARAEFGPRDAALPKETSNDLISFADWGDDAERGRAFERAFSSTTAFEGALAALLPAYRASPGASTELRARLQSHQWTLEFQAILDSWDEQRSQGRENLTPVPQLVFLRGVEAIRAFFRADVNDPAGLRPLRLVVSLVGAANAGKTSLVHTLLDKKFRGQLTGDGPDRTTVGAVFSPAVERMIDNRPTNTPHPHLTFVDFGGQEDYEQTHALFHYNQGVTLIVVDLSTYAWTDVTTETARVALFWERAGFYYEKLAALAPTCNFLVVGTKCDEVSGTPTLSERCEDILRRLRNLEQDRLIRIRKETNELPVVGADERRAQLEASLQVRPQFLLGNAAVHRTALFRAREAEGVRDLDGLLSRWAVHNGTALPHGYVLLSNALSKLRIRAHAFPVASLAEVHAVARSAVSADLFASLDDLQLGLEALRDAGELLWYRQAPDRVFLSPLALADLLKGIAHHDLALAFGAARIPGGAKVRAKLRLRQEGRITFEHLSACFPAWRAACSDETTRATVVQLLEQFRLAHAESTEGDEPCLYLPYAMAYTALPAWSPSIAVKRLAVRAWEFSDFVPTGLLPSIVVACRKAAPTAEVLYRVLEREFWMRASTPGGAADVHFVIVDGAMNRALKDSPASTAAHSKTTKLVRAPTLLVLEVWAATAASAFQALNRYGREVDLYLNSTYNDVAAAWTVDPVTGAYALVESVRAAMLRGAPQVFAADTGDAIELTLLVGDSTTALASVFVEDFPRAEPAYKDAVAAFAGALLDADPALVRHTTLMGSIARGTDLSHDVDVAVQVSEAALGAGPGSLQELAGESGKSRAGTFLRRFMDVIERALENKGLDPRTARPQSHSVSYKVKFAVTAPPALEVALSVDFVPVVHLETAPGSAVFVDLVPDFTANAWEPTCAGWISRVPAGVATLNDGAPQRRLLVWLIRAVKAWKKRLEEAADCKLMSSTFVELFVRAWFGSYRAVQPVSRAPMLPFEEQLLQVLTCLAKVLRGDADALAQVKYPHLKEITAWWQDTGAREFSKSVASPLTLTVAGMVARGADVQRAVALALDDTVDKLVAGGVLQHEGGVRLPAVTPAVVAEVARAVAAETKRLRAEAQRNAASALDAVRVPPATAIKTEETEQAAQRVDLKREDTGRYAFAVVLGACIVVAIGARVLKT